MKNTTRLLCHLAIMVGLLVWPITGQSTERPNVVLMLADNLGFGDIGAYGGGAVLGAPTPSLDGLAAEGLMLTQFFVEPGCTPSRAGLMTGRYSVRSGLNSIIVAGTPLTLKDEEFTIAELFKKHGYQLAASSEASDLREQAEKVLKALGEDLRALPSNRQCSQGSVFCACLLIPDVQSKTT